MRRNRAVVDNATTLWVLGLHDSESSLCAQKGACQINPNNSLPLIQSELLQRNGWCSRTGIVEQQVQPTERRTSRLEKVLNRLRVTHVRWHRDDPFSRTRLVDNGVQQFSSPARQYD